MKAQRSWRSRCAYMLAGEVAMLALWLSLFAFFHTLVGSAENLEVGLTERKLSRLNGGRPSFDFVNPVEEFTHGRMVAAGRLCGELHRGRLDLRNSSSSPVHRGGYRVAGSLHDESAEIFRTLRSSLWVAARALLKSSVLGWITAADLLPRGRARRWS